VFEKKDNQTKEGLIGACLNEERNFGVLAEVNHIII